MMPALPLFVAVAVAVSLHACGGGNTPSNVSSPGEPRRTDTRALEAGAGLLQDKPPVDALDAYLNGFHFYSGRPSAQMEAHHYCNILDEDLIQCVIYDGNVRTARLMGVEYIVSASLFAKLPDDEKALWHSHVHEVKSGQLIAPGLPQPAEHAVMEKIVGTYGKTVHTWHTDRHESLPVGLPQLMMGFTADGQVDAGLVRSRDERFGVNSEERRRYRADIPSPPVLPGADAWQQGKVVQIDDPLHSR